MSPAFEQSRGTASDGLILPAEADPDETQEWLEQLARQGQVDPVVPAQAIKRYQTWSAHSAEREGR